MGSKKKVRSILILSDYKRHLMHGVEEESDSISLWRWFRKKSDFNCL